VSRNFVVLTVLLALLIWAAFYLASLPLASEEVPIIVAVSAGAVYLARAVFRRLRGSEKPKEEGRA